MTHVGTKGDRSYIIVENKGWPLGQLLFIEALFFRVEL